MLTNEERKIFRQKAIMNNGYYDKNSNWNAIKVINGNIYRDRVETLIIKDGKYVFIKLAGEKGKYKLPGGSLGKDITPETQAINECHEETHFEVSNVQSTGITYKVNYTDTKRSKDNEYQYGVKYIGAFTSIFIADYAGEYNGKIASVDEDPYIRSGKWYTFKEAFGIFNQWHRDALSQYIKTQQIHNDVTVTESYISNWFVNEWKLWSKEIRTDTPKETVDWLIKVLNDAYKKNKNNKKFIKDSLFLFAQINRPTYKETDKFSKDFIQFCINFVNTSMGPAYAFTSDSGDNVVVLAPEFFTLNKDSQIFVLLHEIGHIRLGHTAPENTPCDLFGNPLYSQIRRDNILKGKTMYTELNADLYAILNGAKLFAILDTAYKKDFNDNGNPYIYSNYELANRYKKTTERVLRRNLYRGLPKIGQ